MTKQQQVEMLEQIEQSPTPATLDEWTGVLHVVAMNEEQPMEVRIRALAQMDRITGEDGDLTEHGLRDYVNLCAEV